MYLSSNPVVLVPFKTVEDLNFYLSKRLRRNDKIDTDDDEANSVYFMSNITKARWRDVQLEASDVDLPMFLLLFLSYAPAFSTNWQSSL